MRDSLKSSIISVIGAYFLLQCGIFLGFSLPVGFFARYALAFFLLSTGFHAFLLCMLFLFKKDFVLERTGETLTKVNTANRITLFRVSTLPTLLILILAAKDFRIRIPLLCLVVLVFLSDFVDGYVSRKGGEVTRVGRMMDSASDYSLLIVLTVVFYYFSLVPFWFFALVVGRLLLQSILMATLYGLRKHLEPKTTPLGKIAVASIMILYAIEVARIAFGGGASPKTWPFLACEWAAGAIIAVSVFDKIISFARELSAGKPGEKTGTAA